MEPLPVAEVCLDLLPEMTTGPSLPSRFKVSMPAEDVDTIADFLNVERRTVMAVSWLTEAYLADRYVWAREGEAIGIMEGLFGRIALDGLNYVLAFNEDDLNGDGWLTDDEAALVRRLITSTDPDDGDSDG